MSVFSLSGLDGPRRGVRSCLGRRIASSTSGSGLRARLRSSGHQLVNTESNAHSEKPTSPKRNLYQFQTLGELSWRRSQNNGLTSAHPLARNKFLPELDPTTWFRKKEAFLRAQTLSADR